MLNTKKQQKIDEIMYETNDKISSIVSEIRQIIFSKLAGLPITLYIHTHTSSKPDTLVCISLAILKKFPNLI